MSKKKREKQRQADKHKQQVLSKKTARLAIAKAKEKAAQKGAKKIGKATQKTEKRIVKAIQKTEKKILKKDDKKLRLRKCTGCGKEIIGKQNKCFNCKVDSLEKKVSLFKKAFDFVMDKWVKAPLKEDKS